MPRKTAPSDPSLPAEAAFASAPDIEPLLRELTGRVLDALNRNTAAVLAAGIMSSRGRPHSPDEAIRLHQEMINTIWPRVPSPPTPAEEDVAA
jgi:hypothetical protein